MKSSRLLPVGAAIVTFMEILMLHGLTPEQIGIDEDATLFAFGP